MAAFSFSLILCSVVVTVFANEYTENESDLRKRLFENYDKLVRPVRSAGDVIPVQVILAPLRVKDVDVKDKTVKLDTWLYLRWKDDYLSWFPSEYAGLEELSISANEVWRPDIGLYSASPDTNAFPSVLTNVVIFHNGTILWIPPYSFKSRCPPTDDQVTADTFECTLEMGSWTYDVRRVTVQEREQDVLQRFTISTDTMAGATNRNTLQNECCSAAPVVGGMEEGSALFLVDDLRKC
ncbi:Neuronal acetylcholine receptor subunit alpha-6 [Araneus ventricosus]|uniref:Neuronal acetylcholine receptor subunit alpha-6 n=1 Tax=Araneus ventricosus TaxID=182803 RepID=A0A4Y2G6B5_ARAVE|nr:Neuronal acetylcholine receptor subunit alpha-6 [Araneus ventricosus]